MPSYLELYGYHYLTFNNWCSRAIVNATRATLSISRISPFMNGIAAETMNVVRGKQIFEVQSGVQPVRAIVRAFRNEVYLINRWHFSFSD